MTVGSLFSGVGGLDLGFERAGFEMRWMCEQNKFCQQVLARHWPGVPIYDDVRTLSERTVEPVDALIGGFPCQDISVAGKGEGIDGEQSRLWWDMHGIIGRLRPRYAVMENVPALTGRGLGAVLGALSEIGYDAEWTLVSAASVGAPHIRERIFIVAYPQCEQSINRRDAHMFGRRPAEAQQARMGSSRLAYSGSTGRQKSDASAVTAGTVSRSRRSDAAWIGGEWAMPEPVIRGVADGVSEELDRLKALGNAVVPAVSEYVARCVRAHAEATGQWRVAA